MNLPGRTRPSGAASLVHAILAKRAPSGQGEMLPDWAALTAMSLPRMKRKVLLSPRSVVLMGRQDSKAGSNGTPFHSGCTAVRGIGDEVSGGRLGRDAGHGARYAFRVASSSGVTLASGCSLTNCGRGMAPSWIMLTAS